VVEFCVDRAVESCTAHYAVNGEFDNKRIFGCRANGIGGFRTETAGCTFKVHSKQVNQ